MGAGEVSACAVQPGLGRQRQEGARKSGLWEGPLPVEPTSLHPWVEVCPTAAWAGLVRGQRGELQKTKLTWGCERHRPEQAGFEGFWRISGKADSP